MSTSTTVLIFLAPLSHDLVPVESVPASRRQPRPFVFAVLIIASDAVSFCSAGAVFAGHLSISQSVNLFSAVGFPFRMITAPVMWVSAELLR